MTAPTILTRGPLAPQRARNASLQDLFNTLQLQRRQAVDLVLPASTVRMHDGLLEVAGAEPVLRPDGVLDPNGAYQLTSYADGQLAGVFDIPVKYVRRLRDEHVDLLDHNVNEWANHPSYAEKKVLARLFWAQDPDNPDTVGVARAFLSNRFGARDNFDTLVAVLDGIREAGLAATSLQFKGDLTERKFYLVVRAPEITGTAHKFMENYRNPWPEHAGRSGDELPIVDAGFIVTNSEIGSAALSVTPRIVFRWCDNGAQQAHDAVAFRHSGARLDEGNVDWSVDTRAAANELSKKQVRDAVSTFLNVDYVQAKIDEMERDCDAPVEKVADTIEAVAQEFGYTEEEASSIMNFFIDGGQRTAGGVMNAVTAAVQEIDDADRAYEIEATALDAMAFAARQVMPA